jgi:hypothetical protein
MTQHILILHRADQEMEVKLYCSWEKESLLERGKEPISSRPIEGNVLHEL